MADPIRLYAEFSDDLGGDWRLNIHEAGYGGSITEFNLGADGFTMRYSGDNENRMQPIIGSEVTFTLVENLAQHTTFLESLATSEDAAYTISIYKDPDGDNSLFWTGVLLHEQVELQDISYPISNTLTAVDDLGNLKNVLYNNSGSAYTGRDTIAEHLIKILNKTRALHVYETTDVFLKYANDFKPSTFVSNNALIELEVNHGAFYNVDEDGFVQFFTAFDVLQNLAITFNARIFFAEGYFWFIPVGAPKNNVTVNVHTVTKGTNQVFPTSTISAGTTAIDTRVTVGTNAIKLKGGSTTFLPALNKVERTWQTNNNLPLLGPVTQYLNATGLQTALGTAVNDNSLAYDQGTELRLEFLYTHSFQGDGTSLGASQHARIILKISLQVGSLYYKNAVTFGPNTMGVGNFENNYEVDVMTFSPPAWSSTAGYFYVPVTPTPNYLNRNDGFFYNWTNFPTNLMSLAPNGDPLIIDLDQIPSTQTGITIAVDVEGYDSEGNLITDVTGTNATGKLQNLNMNLLAGGLTNGDRIVYSAVTQNTNQEIYQQPDVFIGSSTNNDIKNIYENNSIPDQPVDSFVSLENTTANFSIHKLGVKEILAGQNLSTRVKRGQFYKLFVSPFNTLKFGSRDFLPFETSYTARPVEAEYEAFEFATNEVDVSVPEPHVINDFEPVDTTEPIYDLRNTALPTSGDLPPNIFQRLLQQPITDVENRDGGTYTVRSIDALIFNTWAGPNGSSSINLPTTTGNDGRILRFKSDSTISANTYVRLRPNNVSETIDGATHYDFNRSYDGMSLLCHNSNWFIIQKKEK